MNKDFFAIYDALISGVKSDECISNTIFGERWGLVETDTHSGMAMVTPVDSMPAVFPGGLEGMTLTEAAAASKSWNLTEATLGLAAINAYYNTPERLSVCDFSDGYYAEDIDFSGKTVGLIGHLKSGDELKGIAKKVYIIERDPQSGDYPDAACDFILPQCDIVLITGSSLVNKTLPHLLTLCENSLTLLVGPSVPMCPALLDFGIDRISGMVVSDRGGIRAHVSEGRRGSPYPYGQSFTVGRR